MTKHRTVTTGKQNCEQTPIDCGAANERWLLPLTPRNSGSRWSPWLVQCAAVNQAIGKAAPRAIRLQLNRCCVLVIVLWFAVTANGWQQQPTASDAQLLAVLPEGVPAVRDQPTSAAAVALGKQLFFDPRLSGNNKMSCATCHQPQLAFADAQMTAVGANNKKLPRNTPTCLNVGFYKAFFWDGRVESLEAQALIPITSADEMDQDLEELERELRAIPAYVRQFSVAFGHAPDRQGVAKALAAFQRTLVSGASPFDRYLRGDKAALSTEAQAGLALFRGTAGCVTCHRGPLLSDERYYRLGVSFRDQGRAAVTADASDRFRFRTPSLRNVARTGPYMHDGSLPTLHDVVTFYYRGVPDAGPHGLQPDTDALTGESYSDIPLLVAFLESLTGDVPECTSPLLPGIVSQEPDTAISPAQRDPQGFLRHVVETPRQEGLTDIRVLLPERRIAQMPVVYVLPVEPGRAQRYGDGLIEVRRQDLHNRFGALFVAPSFAALPWYADHDEDPRRAQEAYLLHVVVPYIEQTYDCSPRADQHHLLGFSKSGWGAWSLLLRHPDKFGRAVAWDAPLMMRQLGEYGTADVFGSEKNFVSYRLSDLIRQQASGFRDAPRLFHMGYGNFREHHQQAHELLEQLNVSQVYRDGPKRQHDWHSGWLTEAVELLFTDARRAP